MNGFINLLKPAGMTSHDVVSALRRILGIKKIGHTGTLDPMAAGVLPMCIGKATRAAEYLESDRKRYRCELLLGAASDTADVWGRVCLQGCGAAGRLTAQQVSDAILSLKGPQLQYPPMYSAVRKNGKHLYEYAREGITVEVEPRSIVIYDIYPVRIFHEPLRVIFDVECSKGTYIRTICREIGEILGCGAIMTFLVRTRSGAFDIADSVTLEEIIERIAQNEGLTAGQVINSGKTAGPDISAGCGKSKNTDSATSSDASGDRDKSENIDGTTALDTSDDRDGSESAGRAVGPGKKLPDLTASLSDILLPIGKMLPDFGEILLSPQEMKKYSNGGKIALKNVVLCRKNSRQPDDRFSDIYCVCSEDGAFAGTAKFDSKKKIFTAGKVLIR